MTSALSLELQNVGKAYGARRVLGGIDLRLRGGEFLAIIGRSGCGKSTLLRLICALERPDAGRIVVGGQPNEGMHADVRMIFQEARLLPWSSVLANVGLGARAELRARRLARERDARANELLARVGLADRAAEWPGRLSGGQRQRVALARGLMSDPGLLLLDEPLGALDALTRLEMQQLLERLWFDRGFTAVMVTHEIQEAVALADRVVVLEDGMTTLDVALPMPRPRDRESREFVATCARLLRHIVGDGEVRHGAGGNAPADPQPSPWSVGGRRAGAAFDTLEGP